MTPTFGPDLQRLCLTFWQREGHIPSWIYLGLTNHLSSLQSYQLLNYGWEVGICGQKPGPGLIKPELAPSFQGQSTPRNPTACFPRTLGQMKNASLPKDNVFSDLWMAADGVSKTSVNTSGFEWDGKKTEMDYQGDLQKLLPIWLHPISLKQYVEQFGGALEKVGERNEWLLRIL